MNEKERRLESVLCEHKTLVRRGEILDPVCSSVGQVAVFVEFRKENTIRWDLEELIDELKPEFQTNVEKWGEDYFILSGWRMRTILSVLELIFDYTTFRSTLPPPKVNPYIEAQLHEFELSYV